MAVEDVVAEGEGNGVAIDPVCGDQEGLSDAFGFVLHPVLNAHSEIRSVAEHPLEDRDVVRRRDQQDVSDAREHERGQRVIDHRLVIDRQELLGNAASCREQSSAGSACE